MGLLHGHASTSSDSTRLRGAAPALLSWLARSAFISWLHSRLYDGVHQRPSMFVGPLEERRGRARRGIG